ncbi:MAG: hypothetical protein CME93_04715 [Hyphomonadaceae bacterium]|nr:hypothetical protein [Hyphomonadaceae bacterium]OUX94676.1 MAG: hypothetical protein CBB77_06290 [Hyphomonas sp. TMED17]
MVRGLPASILLHLAVVGLGYLSWPVIASDDRSSEDLFIVPVELVDLSETTNIAAVTEEAPAEEPPVEAVEEEPTETAMEELLDELLPEDELATSGEFQQPEQAVPEETAPDFVPDAETAEPETAESDTTQPLAADSLDSFLSQAESTFSSERPTRTQQEPLRVPERQLEDNTQAPIVRRGAGARSANTARLEALLYSQLYRCWDGVDDQPQPDQLNVSLSVELDISGNLKGNIRWISPSRLPLGRSPMRVAMERAQRAVQKCAPYNLPRQEYSSWQTINVNLGPAFKSTTND